MAVVGRNHILLLDGMRGLAAVGVVAYHYGDRVGLPYFMPRGYLAVDFFFLLSGFVIALAYEQRLRAGMTAEDFCVRRVIRLWPMLLAGIALGAAVELWRPGTDGNQHLVDVLSAVVAGSVAVPMLAPTSMEATIFPLNGPIWSLFLELIANTVFLVAVKSARLARALVWLVVLGGVGMLACAAGTGKLDVGARLTDWPEGLPRVAFSFFLGVILFTSGKRLMALSPTVLCLALGAILMIPKLGGIWDPAFDLAVAFVVFPVLVGSASVAAADARLYRFCKVSGEISYPLYMIHYPIVRVISFAVNRHTIGVPARLALGVLSVAAICSLAYVLLRLYDEPLRTHLTRRFGTKRRTPVGALIVGRADPERAISDSTALHHKGARI